MQSVEQILKAHGYDSVEDLPVNEPIEVDGGPAMMPLVIEKVRDDVVSVEHYYTKRMDRISDPEMRFRVEDGEWNPIEYSKHHPPIRARDEDGLDSAVDFARKWDKNIEKQGYVERAQQKGGA